MFFNLDQLTNDLSNNFNEKKITKVNYNNDSEKEKKISYFELDNNVKDLLHRKK
jgi:hypothetical protein